LDFFSVSIDGPRAYHDRVRGVEGAFDKAVNGLRLLIQAKKQKGIKVPHVRIASIIDPQNFENSIFVINLANELKVDEIAFGNLMFYTPQITKEQSLFRDKTGLEVSSINGIELEQGYKFYVDEEKVRKFMDYVHKSSKISVNFVPPKVNFVDYYSYKNPSPESKCLNPWFSVTIMPDGGVTACQGLILGNIQQDRLSKLWNNKMIRRFRTARKKCQLPGCFRCCEGQIIRFD